MTTSPARAPFLDRLGEALASSDFAWALCLLGEDQAVELTALTGGLRGDDRGDRKHISSGFSYWGIGPAIAWQKACDDSFYPVMYKSIESFARNWATCLSELDLETNRYHYVSLGVGTGAKDSVAIRDLLLANPDLLYVPVDMSTELLRIGAQRGSRGLPRGHMLPVQLDVSVHDNVDELRKLLDGLVGDAPILFGLLGNTVANFDDDVELLTIVTTLLRHQDRLLLEAATTRSMDVEGIEQAAAAEYRNSQAFKEFATSALWHNTDLTLNMNAVRFHGELEGDRAIRIEVHYHNLTGETIQITLPNRDTVDFTPAQTIRLYLSRKYSAKGLEQLVRVAGLKLLRSAEGRARRHDGRSRFGVDLMVLAPAESKLRSPVADDIWRH